MVNDDLGTPVDTPSPARRVVSLVPSLTEAIAATRPDALVGATDWCTRPTGLDVPRVRGTKNPDLAAIRALEPDLVVANREENRELDVRRLREAGVPVWVSVVETVPQALMALRRLFEEALDWEVPDWLTEVENRWEVPKPPVTGRVAVPIWRDPWMVVGRDTFTGDVLRRLGWANVYADGGASGDRYPTVTTADIEATSPDVVMLPDEPYVFTAEDGPDAFGVPTRLVSGRLLTWYGPSLLEAAEAPDLRP